MGREYKVKQVYLRNIHNEQKEQFMLETYFQSKRLEAIKKFLLINVDIFIEKSWGKFGKDFIIQHVIKAEYLQLLKSKDKIVAFASADNKRIEGQEVLYLEFTAVRSDYRGYGISTILNGDLIIGEYIRGLRKRWFRPLNVITISRNLRVIGSLGRFANYIYPDPKEFKLHGRLKPANDFTWKLVNNVLKDSWNPHRTLLREGCVLIGSYQNMPWLITDSIEKHYLPSVKGMGEYYLQLSKRADREFMIHTRVNLWSAVGFIMWKMRAKY